MLGRQVRGRVRKVAGEAEQVGKPGRGLRKLDVNAERLPNRQLDQLVGHDEPPVKVGGNGLTHGTILPALDRSVRRRLPGRPGLPNCCPICHDAAGRASPRLRRPRESKQTARREKAEKPPVSLRRLVVVSPAKTRGDAFGVANNSTLTLLDLLLDADAQAVNGVLYGGNAAKRNEANAVFSAVNQAGGI